MVKQRPLVKGRWTFEQGSGSPQVTPNRCQAGIGRHGASSGPRVRAAMAEDLRDVLNRGLSVPPGPDRLDRQEGQIRRPGRFGAGLVQAAARGEKVEQVILGQEQVRVPGGFEPRAGATALGGGLITVTVDDVDRRIGKGRCQPRQGVFGQPVPGTNRNQDVGGAGADPAAGRRDDGVPLRVPCPARGGAPNGRAAAG